MFPMLEVRISKTTSSAAEENPMKLSQSSTGRLTKTPESDDEDELDEEDFLTTAVWCDQRHQHHRVRRSFATCESLLAMSKSRFQTFSSFSPASQRQKKLPLAIFF